MKCILLGMVKAYRKYLSPFIAPSCRFQPTCSQYALDALEQYGAWKGMCLTARRLCRCHPFNPGGYDPVEPIKRRPDHD